jgi:branched-subunit amino acid ABC-type transport system permease component
MEWTGLMFYGVSFLIAGGIYAILCLALNIQWGMGGLFNAGIAGFFAVGAYASAIMTTAASDRHLGGYSMPIPVGLAVAALLAGVTGWVVAKICVRLKSDYLAMASIGIAEILRLVIVNESWLTNGSLGISGIPRPFDGWVQGRAADFVFLATVWIVVAIVYVFAARLNDSPWGRAMRAIRDNEAAARAAGKDVDWFRLQSFVIGAAIMGGGGGTLGPLLQVPVACGNRTLAGHLPCVGDAHGGRLRQQPRRGGRRPRHLGDLVDDGNPHQPPAAGMGDALILYPYAAGGVAAAGGFAAVPLRADTGEITAHPFQREIAWPKSQSRMSRERRVSALQRSTGCSTADRGYAP